MKCNVNIVCNDEGRKAVLEANTPPRNGIQAVEIVHKLDSDPLVQRVLAVFFFGNVPANLIWIDSRSRVGFVFPVPPSGYRTRRPWRAIWS
jgi:hypothetical protein